jgi:hypothetical protein
VDILIKRCVLDDKTLVATNLEDCLCETQETRAIEGIQICYQPKKTASTPQGVGRKS